MKLAVLSVRSTWCNQLTLNELRHALRIKYHGVSEILPVAHPLFATQLILQTTAKPKAAAMHLETESMHTSPLGP